jgi:hypothetical protein
MRGRTSPSTRDARLQVVEHIPEPVDLATLDDFQGFQAVEGVVRGVEPVGDLLGADD